jgi:hypothetical protein
MCNFLSFIIYRDKAIFHHEGNSHSESAKLSGRKENTNSHYLKQALEEGKHLDTRFANFPSVKANSKSFIGYVTYANGDKWWYMKGRNIREH